jgi:hypothetical protein
MVFMAAVATAGMYAQDAGEHTVHSRSLPPVSNPDTW